jgi:hypothetical protein
MVGGGQFKMTKKYWNDWQKRVGETKNIYLFFGQNGWRRKCYNGVLNELAGDILLKAEFHGNAVDLTIERWHHTLTRAMRIENEYLTLHREEIACIKFN